LNESHCQKKGQQPRPPATWTTRRRWGTKQQLGADADQSHQQQRRDQVGRYHGKRKQQRDREGTKRGLNHNHHKAGRCQSRNSTRKIAAPKKTGGSQC